MARTLAVVVAGRHPGPMRSSTTRRRAAPGSVTDAVPFSAAVLPALAVLAVLAVSACTPQAPDEDEPRFTAVPAEAVVGGEDQAAEMLATAISASTPTTLRSATGVEEGLDRTGATPDEVVGDFTTGDYSEPMTPRGEADLAALVTSSEWLAGYERVDVEPCSDDVRAGAEPFEAWHHAETDEVLWRTCVHVTAVPGDMEDGAPVAESLDQVVLAREVPPGDDTAGLGPISRVVVLDEEQHHRIADSGLPWYEHVADLP
jgi:hypothetical protein